MWLYYLILSLPVVIFWALAAIPPGPVLTWVQRLVLLILGFLWIAYLLGLPPIATADPKGNALIFFGLLILTAAAVGGAATGTVGRGLAERVPALRYPAVSIIMFILTCAPIFVLFVA